MNYAGKLLIANPKMPKESIFNQSVIYLYQDSNKFGTIGLMLNKPSSFTVKDICNDKKIQYHSEKELIYHGGPVGPNALVMLHTNEWESLNTTEAFNDLRISSDNYMLEKIAQNDQPAHWRLFGGLCGWIPGQLIAEIHSKPPYEKFQSWLVASATPKLIFETPIEEQWKEGLLLAGSQMFDQYF